jgi:hypothetical protein
MTRDFIENVEDALNRTLEAKFNPSDVLHCSNKHPLCKQMWRQRRTLYTTNKAEKMAICLHDSATQEEYVKWRDEKHAMKLRHVNSWLKLYTHQRHAACSFLSSQKTHLFSSSVVGMTLDSLSTTECSDAPTMGLMDTTPMP